MGLLRVSSSLLQISDFYHNLLPVDGIWIDMNEISNFCNGECTQLSDSQHNRSKLHPWDGNVGFDPNNPPYQIDNQDSNAALNVKTLDMDLWSQGMKPCQYLYLATLMTKGIVKITLQYTRLACI